MLNNSDYCYYYYYYAIFGNGVLHKSILIIGLGTGQSKNSTTGLRLLRLSTLRTDVTLFIAVEANNIPTLALNAKHSGAISPQQFGWLKHPRAISPQQVNDKAFQGNKPPTGE